MQKYIVIIKNGQAMIFDDYTEAFHASELYTKTTGNVACVESFYSTVGEAKLSQLTESL